MGQRDSGSRQLGGDAEWLWPQPGPDDTGMGERVSAGGQSAVGSIGTTSTCGSSTSTTLAAFVVRQSRIENPLMPLRLFGSRNVSGANVVIALLVVGMFGMFFLGALYLQRILRYDAPNFFLLLRI